MAEPLTSLPDQVDFLCVGGGLGGLAGAVRAHDEGLSVLVAEASDRLGGVTAYSGGVVWMPCNHLQPAQGLEDSLAEADRYMSYLTPEGIQHDERLRRTYLENAAPVTEYFATRAGVRFSIVQRPDQYHPVPGSVAVGRTLEVDVDGIELGPWQDRTWPSAHFKVGLLHTEILQNGGPTQAFDRLADLYQERQRTDRRTHGLGLSSAFVKAALVDRAVPVALQARVVELVMTDGRVSGAVIEHRGGRHRVGVTRGVLIATGSYGHADWAARAEGLPDLVDVSPPVLHGDGLTLTDPTPAALIRAGEAITLVCFSIPGEVHPGTDVPLYRELIAPMGFPHSIVVNRAGRRFEDESFYGRFFTAIKAFDSHTKTFDNFPCFFVVDDRFRRQYGLGPLAPGESWDGLFTSAPTVRELAEKLGIDADGFADQVKRFNAGVEQGEDPEFHRGEVEFVRLAMGDPNYPNPNLGTIEEAPFWGIPLRLMGLGIYSMGLAIDDHARVLTRDGEPVPGLYATGNAVAHTEMCGGYQGGMANGRNMVYASLAAVDAAKAG